MLKLHITCVIFLILISLKLIKDWIYFGNWTGLAVRDRMETTIQIIIMVFVVLTLGEAKGDLENLVNEMQIEMRITRTEMHEMNERLALTEEKLM